MYNLIVGAVRLHVVRTWLVVEHLAQSRRLPVVGGMARRHASLVARRYTADSRFDSVQRQVRRRHSTQHLAVVRRRPMKPAGLPRGHWARADQHVEEHYAERNLDSHIGATWRAAGLLHVLVQSLCNSIAVCLITFHISQRTASLGACALPKGEEKMPGPICLLSCNISRRSVSPNLQISFSVAFVGNNQLKWNRWARRTRRQWRNRYI